MIAYLFCLIVDAWSRDRVIGGACLALLRFLQIFRVESLKENEFLAIGVCCALTKHFLVPPVRYGRSHDNGVVVLRLIAERGI